MLFGLRYFPKIPQLKWINLHTSVIFSVISATPLFLGNMRHFKCLPWCLITQQLSQPKIQSPQTFSLYCHSKYYTISEKKGLKQRWCVCVVGWSAMILTQRSAEIKGTEEEEKKGRKGLVSHAGGCQGCLPKEPHISSLSQIRNEQKFSSVHSDRRPDIEWRPWLSKQAPRYYVYFCLHMGFHSCFYWNWENSSASQTRRKGLVTFRVSTWI